MAEAGEDVVERYFVHLSARDWPALAVVLAADVERVGPLSDRVTGREAYLELLRRSVPEDYGNDVHRITYHAGRRAAFARVTEHLVYRESESESEPAYHLEEAYAFELDAQGAISRVEVFWQTPAPAPGPEASAG
jgi:hypothetical protein